MVRSKSSNQNSEIKDDCTRTLPLAARRGLGLFNERKFWLAHEALEEVWLAERGPIRDLYKGVLQAGVTYLHIQRGNYRGAIRVYQRASRYLEKYPGICQGINMAQLRKNLDAVITEVKRLGPERIDEFDSTLIKSILFED